jgi:hypothetical protein
VRLFTRWQREIDKATAGGAQLNSSPTSQRDAAYWQTGETWIAQERAARRPGWT